MLAPQRHAIIVREVNRLGVIRVRSLAELLEVSEMTVRRDLDQLVAQGRVRKVHGGAARTESRSVEEPGFEIKSELERNEKAAIARFASSLVKPGSALGITGGTTTWLLGEYLLGIADLTIVTNSVSLAGRLHSFSEPGTKVVLTGGARTKSDALVGPVAVNTLRSLHVDTVFMGVHGMAESAGFTTPNLDEVETNQAFIAAGERLVVLADNTKWNIRGFGKIAALNQADLVVSDEGLTAEARTALTEATELHLVPPDGQVTSSVG